MHHKSTTVMKVFVPLDEVMSADARALFPQHSLVHFVTPLLPANDNTWTKIKNLYLFY